MTQKRLNIALPVRIVDAPGADLGFWISDANGQEIEIQDLVDAINTAVSDAVIHLPGRKA